MHPISTIENEYFFKMILHFRKSIPKNEFFYILFFLLKMIPILLFTHATFSSSSSLFTLSKILKATTICNHNLSINYNVISIILYIIILFLFSSLILIYFIFYRLSKQTDKKLYGTISNQIKTSYSFDKFIRFISWFIIIFLLFYQHIMELLSYNIIQFIYSNMNSDYFISGNKLNFELNTSKYVFFGLNTFFFILMIILMFFYFIITSQITLSNNYGYRTSLTKFNIFIYCILFSLQGAFSMSFFLKESIRKKEILIFSYIIVIFFILNALFSLGRINFYSISKIDFLFRIFNNFFIMSGLIEIFSYYLSNEDSTSSQKFYLVIIILDVVNAICITQLLDKIHSNIFISNLAKNYFNSSKKITFILLFQLLVSLKNWGDENKQSFFIFLLLQKHKAHCNNKETCFCQKFQDYMSSSVNEEESTNKIKTFSSFCETHLVDLIINHSKSKYKFMSKFLFLHCEYLLNVKEENALNVIYLTKYYLIKKRKSLSFFDAYLIYEINDYVHDKFDCKFEGFYYILDENALYEKMLKLLYIVCYNFAKLFQFKNYKNTNSIMPFKCEDILNSSKEFFIQSNKLYELIILYNDESLFSHFFELKIFILFYIRFFQIKFPKETSTSLFEGYENEPDYLDILHQLSDYQLSIQKDTFLILVMNNENKFIINYASLDLSEGIMYSMNQLKGNDFHELLIPKYIADFHTIYMKNFILFGGKEYSKKTFVLNSIGQIIPIQLRCRVLPTVTSYFSLIISIDEVIEYDYINYHCLLDNSYFPFTTSNLFDIKFGLIQKLSSSLKVNVIEYFGLNKDEIVQSFKSSVDKIGHKLTELKVKLLTFPAPTTIKKDEIYLYNNIDPAFFKKNKQKVSLSHSMLIEKEKIHHSIALCEKKLENTSIDRIEKTWKLRINPAETTFKATLPTTNGYSLKNESIEAFYNFTFELKYLGNKLYYVLTVSEISDSYNFDSPSRNSLHCSQFQLNSSTFKTNISYVPLKKISTESPHTTLMDNSSLASMQRNGLLINSTNELDSLNKSNENNSYAFLNNNFNQSMSRNLSSVFVNLAPKVNTTQIANPVSNSNYSEIFLEKLLVYVKLSKTLCIIMIVIIFILHISDFIISFHSKHFSLNLFYMNTYSFLLTNDIYFGALSSIITCLVKDQVQLGNPSELLLQVKQSSKDLMEHFYYLNYYTNNIINQNGAHIIYKIFNDNGQYYKINNNLFIEQYESNLNDEIYSYYHQLKNFHAKDDTICRIQEIFFTKSFMENSNNDENTIQQTEKLIFYICANVISNISNKLELLMKEANDLLSKENKKSKTQTVIILGIIIFLSFVILIFVFFGVISFMVVIREKLILLFTKKENEELLLEDIIKFTGLLTNFSLGEFNEYAYFKLGIGENILKTTSEKNLLAKAKGISKYSVKKEKKSKKNSTNNLKKTKNLTKHKNSMHIKKDTIEKTETTNMLFLEKTKPKFATRSIIFIISLFICYFAFQIFNIFQAIYSYDKLIIENNFGTNILSRGPKMKEIVLYSIISVLMNDVEYIKKDKSEYDDYVISNYFNVNVNLQDNSIFQSFDNSNYIYLYYQIYIIRSNINLFVQSKMSKKYLTKTAENEKKYGEGENFCIYVSLYYLMNYYKSIIKDFNSLLVFLTDRVSYCRKIGNGINLDGHNSAMNLILQQLSNRYLVFKKTNDTTIRQMEFFTDVDLLIIQEELLNPFRFLHFADSYSLIEDIENSYKSNFHKKIFYSLISILFNVGLLVTIFIIILYKLYNTIKMLNKIITIIDKLMCNYSSNII